MFGGSGHFALHTAERQRARKLKIDVGTARLDRAAPVSRRFVTLNTAERLLTPAQGICAASASPYVMNVAGSLQLAVINQPVYVLRRSEMNLTGNIRLLAVQRCGAVPAGDAAAAETDDLFTLCS